MGWFRGARVCRGVSNNENIFHLPAKVFWNFSPSFETRLVDLAICFCTFFFIYFAAKSTKFHLQLCAAIFAGSTQKATKYYSPAHVLPSHWPKIFAKRFTSDAQSNNLGLDTVGLRRCPLDPDLKRNETERNMYTV